MKAYPWLTLPALAVLVAAPVQAQNTEAKTPPAPAAGSGQAKPPVHKPEQSALNRAKQDERAKKALEESAAVLKESIRKEQAAAKEAKRLNPDAVKEDPEKALKDLKDKISPEDAAALKEELKKTAKKVLDSEETKQLIEDAKKQGAAAIEENKKSKPSTGPTQAAGTPLPPPPTTFETIPGPVPVAPLSLHAPDKRKVKLLVSADDIIMPPSNDPKNPGKALPPESPLARTSVLSGNAQIKTEDMMVDADHIVCLNQAGGGGGAGGIFGGPSSPKAPDAAPSPASPDKGSAAGGKQKDDSGIENMVATGSVRVVRYSKDKVYNGKGNRMVYDSKAGTITITGWPTVQDGSKIIVGKQESSVIILPSDGGSPKFTDCTVKSTDDKKTAAHSPAASTAGAGADAAASALASGSGATASKPAGGTQAPTASNAPRSGHNPGAGARSTAAAPR